jgi:hypothetical protein
MKRPDQDRFDQFAKHFVSVDERLEQFGNKAGFRLERNLYRTPCKVLRKPGNPEQVFDFYLEDNWLTTEYEEDLPHTLAVASFFTPSQDDSVIFKMGVILVEHQPFAAIKVRLEELLNRGLGMLNSWTPDVIVAKGQRLENLRKKYSEGGV